MKTQKTKYKVALTKTQLELEEVEAHDYHEAVTIALRIHPGAEVSSVDGGYGPVEQYATCESCSRKIFYGEAHYAWSDGVHTCQSCGGSELCKHSLTIAE